MSKFDYVLPSGASFTVQAPAETTQTQADFIFYSQVAAGALVDFVPGQSISGNVSIATKFELSRLDRGTAGVDDTVILSIVNGLPSVANIPDLVDVPLENPVTQADIAAITETGFTAPAIGSLTSDQVLAVMAQVANSVDQPSNQISNDKGVGKYGLSCQQLEIAGYVKPGTWQQFLQSGNNNLVDVLSAPGIWTGLGGIDSADEFLNNVNAQSSAQATLMTNGYNSLLAAGVIVDPASQSVSAVQGVVFTGASSPITNVSTSLTNGVNAQIGSLLANASKFGTQLTAQWAKGLPVLPGGLANLASIKGLNSSLASLSAFPNLGSLTSGLTPNLASVQGLMNNLGKASQFATTAASTLTRGLDRLSNLNVSGLTANLPSVSALAGQLQGQASALLGRATTQLQGQATALLGQATAQLQGQATALIGQAQAQIGAITGNFANLNVSSLFGGVSDSLVASVQKAAGFSNTVNRATVDVAMVKIFGSSKIPVPGLGAQLPSSASIGAALDIGKAQAVLKDIQGQGSRLLGGVQNAIGSSLGGITAQVTALGNQASGQATVLARSATTVFNPGAGTAI